MTGFVPEFYILLHCRWVNTQEFQDLGICDLRFGVGLVGINHVVGDTESLGKFVNRDASRFFLLPLCGELVGLFTVGAFVAGGGKYLHTTGAKWV